MKIKKIDFIAHEMKLAVPYTIAYETIDKTINVFCSAETDSGILGFGCAAPDLEVTGETAESVLKIAEEIIEPNLIGAEPGRYAKVLHNIRPLIAGNPSALAMTDMLLFDLLSKQANIPLYQLLGGFRTRIKTSVTIGILDVEQTIAQAKDFIGKGFKVLKIKGGKDVDIDIERMIKIREEVGKNIELRFDANQGYTVEESKKFVENTKFVKIEILEQPTPKNDLEQLGMVTKNVAIPVMADESLMNTLDAFKLAKKELVDMVNVKLMKVGGIYEALHINSIAKTAGFEVMVGCMDEAALGISAGLHFALARPNVEYADLDGHLDLIGDPTRESVILKNGFLYPSEKNGLGVDYLKL